MPLPSTDVPTHLFFDKLVSPLRRQRIKACRTVVFADAPLGSDPFLVFKALQSEIERAMLDKEDLFGLALN
jgi:hypothetical protein